MHLRPYQNYAVAHTYGAFVSGECSKVLIVIPTGGGKTIIFSRLAQIIARNKRVLILAHREELIQQAVDKLFKSTGLRASIEKADDFAPLDAQIVVASVQTLQRAARRERFAPGHFGLIIVDEAHHCLANSYQGTLNYFEHAWVLGVTATPDRTDKKGLGEYFEHIAYEVTLKELVLDGYLSPIRVQRLPVKIDLAAVRTVAGDYSADDLGEAVKTHLATIAEMLARDFADKKTLVFLPLCRISEEFASQCRMFGIKAEHVEGGSPDRAEILARFTSGQTTLLSNAMLLTEGYDEPTVDCIVCLRPTKSRSLYAQIIGRGTRLHAGKTHLLILDFLWLTGKHKLAKPASLLGLKEEEEAKLATMDGDLLGNAEAVQRDAQEALEEKLKKLANRKAKTIDPLEFELVGVKVADYEPVMKWEEKPPTKPQTETLEKAGVDLEAVPNAGLASKLISAIVDRREKSLATMKQVKLLTRFKVQDAANISFVDAGEIITKRLGTR